MSDSLSIAILAGMLFSSLENDSVVRPNTQPIKVSNY